MFCSLMSWLVVKNSKHCESVLFFWVLVWKIFLYFHPYLGKWSNLTNIFQMGWNHQPVSVVKEGNICDPMLVYFRDHDAHGLSLAPLFHGSPLATPIKTTSTRKKGLYNRPEALNKQNCLSTFIIDEGCFDVPNPSHLSINRAHLPWGTYHDHEINLPWSTHHDMKSALLGYEISLTWTYQYHVGRSVTLTFRPCRGLDSWRAQGEKDLVKGWQCLM